MHTIKQALITLISSGFLVASGGVYAQAPPETPAKVPAGINVKLIGAKEVQDLQDRKSTRLNSSHQ